MSTVWYAKHAGEVFSVEDYKPWYDKVAALIAAKRLDNVSYRFADTDTEYCGFMSEDRQGFDLIMVDGKYRSKCMSHAVELVRPGGILFLDNSDQDCRDDGNNTRIAEALARDLARKSGAQVIEITDFAPTRLWPFFCLGAPLKIKNLQVASEILGVWPCRRSDPGPHLIFCPRDFSGS